MTGLNITPVEGLKKFFGFNKFRGQQEAIIANLMSGNDSFVIMPTGGGKSLCYQLPALMSDGTAIVVSPLIALMKNQVDAIRGFATDDSVAHFLNSSLNKGEMTQVKADVQAGKTKLLYVAPESLNKEENIAFFKGVKISFFAIDEAHCISEWGHDFRPEYRRLRPMITSIGDVPIIALTATATPKVQVDIQKNLGMTDATLYKDSFNRPNLYYEVRPKKDVVKEIVRFVRKFPGKSGIVYCLSRKKVEELAESLQVNGINALPYHAGMDANTRARHQDAFLMEDCDLIVATIAFGMGIDKPDVRFVIHHDIPKSLESYYQETGRAGRDGGEGVCLSFYSYKDIEKLEKFLHGKPVAEMEVGKLLLQEIVSYAETSMCRRKYILHYFGEQFDETGCDSNCDNCKHPKEKIDGTDYVSLLLRVVKSVNEKHKSKYICNLLIGNKNTEIQTYKGHENEYFGKGAEKDDKFWNAAIRQSVLHGLLDKEVESYGTLKITEEGHSFFNKPFNITLLKENDYSSVDDEIIAGSQGKTGIADEVLVRMLNDLKKKVATAKEVPPYAIFSEMSIQEMAFQYPITIKELTNISGVGQGKAAKFGNPFVECIKKYVEENNIERPDDLVVKSLVNKSGMKVHIIQNIDRKIPLEDIASAKKVDSRQILMEIDTIVSSGTKVNIDYYLNECLDEDSVEEIYEYFMEAESGDLQAAYDEFDGDYSEEEILMVRIKFLSEVAN
ncbi:MAG: ATP-dependent DNA helicase RecQ [Sphingobacteriales bacterium]|jgi:ATP-dependent DNA helicase RecQ